MTRSTSAAPRKGADGKWSFVLDLGAGYDRNGEWRERRQARRRGFATKRAATDAMDELRGDIRDGSYVPTADITVGQWMTRWLDSLPAQVKPSTADFYRRNVNTRVIPRIGEMKLTHVDALTLNRLYADLLEDGRADGRGGLSVASVRHVHVAMSRALGDAVDVGKLRHNPATAAKPPSLKAAQRPPMQIWTPDELGAFLTAEADTRHGPAWSFLGYTGCRRGEAVGLLWEDVDLDAGRVSLRRSITVVDGQVHEAETVKTSRSRRSISLQRDLVATLRGWRARQAEDRLLMGAGYADGGYVFTQADGRPHHPSHFSRAFDRAVERHDDLRRIRLHDLRHSHASHLLAAGVPAKAVADRLGHASAAFAMDTYAHLMPAQEADYAEAAADLIAGRGLRAVPDL